MVFLCIFAPMKNAGHKLLALALLAIFATYWSSITLFPHAHRIGDRVYVHSHPFADSSSPHTQEQLQVIEYLSLLLVSSVSLVSVVFSLKAILFHYKVQVVSRRQDAPIYIFGLRAPPAVA